MFSWNPARTTQTEVRLRRVCVRVMQWLMGALSAHGHAGKCVTLPAQLDNVHSLAHCACFAGKTLGFALINKLVVPQLCFKGRIDLFRVCIRHYETSSPSRALSRTLCHWSFRAPQGVLKHIKRPLVQIQDACNLTALNKCKCSMPEDMKRSPPLDVQGLSSSMWEILAWRHSQF